MTVDLFLDLAPFTTQASNVYGANIDVSHLLSRAGLDLVEGAPRELHGFPDFDADRILRHLPEKLIGRGWPTLTQLVVARKGSTRPELSSAAGSRTPASEYRQRMDEQGIVYVATGRPSCLAEAVVSAQSAKRVMPEIPITLFTDLDAWGLSTWFAACRLLVTPKSSSG